MVDDAHFSVDARLTRLLGETYRSSEVAIKELVDNAWDADATNVWITLPSPMSAETLTVIDDGTGMTVAEVLSEYLNIASDKRGRTGDRTGLYRRTIKGRKGIGKFAGLTIANKMLVEAVARGRKCTLLIDKKALVDQGDDLEAVPLPFSDETAESQRAGVKITLTELDNRLNFPTADRLREVLVREYGREDNFRVHVNGLPLSVKDVPGPTKESTVLLPTAGSVRLHFTIAEGKRAPKSPGIVLKVDGKAVGRPTLFGLDDDEEIPPNLLKRLYGEVHLTGMEDQVTADWGAVIENSKALQEAEEYVRAEVKEELKVTRAKDMNLQKARIQRQINNRLQGLPEYRRSYAQNALNRILMRFYGESEERISTIVGVALDAMEQDAYWQVLEQIGRASHGDITEFAESLEQFGLLELSTIAAQANNRRRFLDYLDQLVSNPDTLEKQAHTAMASNLWILGRKYSMMSSNETLRTIVERYCHTKFTGPRHSQRPDLLLSQDYGETYLLIEFKRPSHDISRDDISQAEQYRDELSSKLSSRTRMDLLLIGRGRVETLNTNNLLENISIHSYASIISTARNEINWLISTLLP